MTERRQAKPKPTDEFTSPPTVQPFNANEARRLRDALDQAADEAEGPAEMKGAAKKALKDKGYTTDAFDLAWKLHRKKSVEEARVFLEALDLYCMAFGLLDEDDAFRAHVAKAPQPELFN